jgi:uncharacterized protein (DUF1800 family)
MVLFWHNHFATSNTQVQNTRLVQRYVQLLRSHALGRFSTLLEGIVRDPATLIASDLGANSRARPSENLARAILECFTVGPGNYSEQDVHEAARALTGWSIMRRQVRYTEADRDSGRKKLFGQEGDFSGGDVVRILLEQPATPRLVVRKLYRWLISESAAPADPLLAPLVESFAKDYDSARLVETMLRSNLFFSPAAYRQRIKSPVEFALGIVRPLEALIPTRPLGHDLAGLGQDLFHPPTVYGWEGGRAWITTATLVRRSNLAAALLAGSGPYAGKLDPRGLAGKHGFAAPEAAARFFIDLLHPDLSPERRAFVSNPTAQHLRRMLYLLVTLPEFELN